MNTRKEWKKAGKKSLKTHYWIFITVCLLAAIIGTEYEVSLEFFSADKDNIRVVKQAEEGKKVVDKVREEGSAALPSTLDDRFSENIMVDLAKGNADKAEKKTIENEKKEK